eukprot:1143418-Pelagomonas_calceolata.AAC.7
MSSSTKGRGASKQASVQARAHAQARVCTLEGGNVRIGRKRRVVRRARKGKATVRRMTVRVREGGVHHVTAVMKRARRGVAALRVDRTLRTLSTNL